MRKIIKAKCLACGKLDLSKDEIGINRKLLGKEVKEFYCLDCLATYLEVTVEDITDRIEEFKAEGCNLFD